MTEQCQARDGYKERAIAMMFVPAPVHHFDSFMDIDPLFQKNFRLDKHVRIIVKDNSNDNTKISFTRFRSQNEGD